MQRLPGFFKNHHKKTTDSAPQSSFKRPSWVEIGTLCSVIVLGSLNFYFIAYPDVKTKEGLAAAEIEKKKKDEELTQVQKKLADLEVGIKAHKDALSVEGAELVNKLNRIEVAVKEVKDNLDIEGRRVKLSSDIVQIENDLKPSVVLEYQSQQVADNRVTVFFSLSNKGKYPCNIKQPKILVTKHKMSGKDGDGDGDKIESNTEYYGPYNEYSAGEKQTVSFQINFKESVPQQFFARITLTCETPKEILDSVLEHLEKSMSIKKLKSKKTFTMYYSYPVISDGLKL